MRSWPTEADEGCGTLDRDRPHRGPGRGGDLGRPLLRAACRGERGAQHMKATNDETSRDGMAVRGPSRPPIGRPDGSATVPPAAPFQVASGRIPDSARPRRDSRAGRVSRRCGECVVGDLRVPLPEPCVAPPVMVDRSCKLEIVRKRWTDPASYASAWYWCMVMRRPKRFATAGAGFRFYDRLARG